MKKYHKISCFFIVLCILFLTLGNVSFATTYTPTNDFFVNDFAGILSHETESLWQQQAEEIFNNTTAQVVVATVENLNQDSVENVANTIFNAWKIGTAGKDNGILLLIAKEERKVRIEIGYGLEGAINDAKAGRILDDVAIPYMKANNYDTAVQNIITQLKGIIYQEYQIEGGFDNYENSGNAVASILFTLGIAIFIVIFTILSVRSGGVFGIGINIGGGGRSRRWLLWWGRFLRRRRLFWWWPELHVDFNKQ